MRAFSPAWPAGVPVQIHAMADDAIFVTEGDLAAARALVDDAGAELFLYPGDQHLFTDASLGAHDPAAAAQLTRRVLDFVAAR
jgi:dienelactone hydrolase